MRHYTFIKFIGYSLRYIPGELVKYPGFLKYRHCFLSKGYSLVQRHIGMYGERKKNLMIKPEDIWEIFH